MPPEALPPPTKLRVLYIDDDVALCRLVSRNLTQHGFVVTTATNAHLAMNLLRSSEYDLIVLDHYMPEQDGLETLAQINREIRHSTPVVYLTGSQEGSVAVAALKAGAADYVIKSVKGEFLDLLHNAIRQAIERLNLRREREVAHRAIEDANHRLEALVERQAVLLGEMNHRIANSLALVGSLLRLQISTVNDESARHALTDTEHRLAAVMQVHRRLYRSVDVEKIELSEYLRGLLAELEQSLTGTEGRHRLLLEATQATVATDRVIPVGVIVTELVTNAVKYAYPAEDASGQIRILLRRDSADSKLMLTVEDDGVGLGNALATNGSGLGRRVIDAMAVSLDARVIIDQKHRGVRVTVAFPA